MRQFYLYKNSWGYYMAVMIDPVSGLRRGAKSTHTKDKVEATVLAAEWAKGGMPEAKSHSRAFLCPDFSSPKNVKSIVDSLSDSDAQLMFSMLSSKLGLTASISPTPVSTPAPVQNSVPDTVLAPNSSSVEKPASKKSDIKLCEFLINFWDYDKSDALQRSFAKGKKLSRMHTDAMKGLAKNHWLPYFGEDKLVEDLEPEELDDFFFYLYTEKGLTGSTVNHAITCGSKAIGYLFDKRKISVNPMAGVERYGINNEKRDIPTETEVRKLLELEWRNSLGKLAFQLAAYCGLRAGEISGLRVCDIDMQAELLHIRHSWNEKDGLKCTKNTEDRDVPVPRELLLQLMNRARRNPNYSDLSYVFFSNVKPEIPCRPAYYQDSFYEALGEIGVSEEQRKERNIVFHSLRHFCATLLAQRTDIKNVKAILGHKSAAMSLHYADHETQEKLNNMRNIMKNAWKDCISA